MKQKRIKVLMVEPGKHPFETELDNDLDSLQKAVSIGTDYQGLIEIIPIEPGVVFLCNEEGKLENLLPNLNFGCDYIAGDCFFVGDDYENGDFKSLTENQIEEVKSICKEREFIYLIEIDNPDEKEIR